MNNNNLLQTVRGTKDILPSEQAAWNFVNKLLEETAAAYGFSRIDTPVFEYSWIYTKAIGETSDIVSKEMYYLRHKDADLDVALRPEGTAGVVRAYYEHGLHSEPSPVRLYYNGPMFRHERPQKGRGRQFNQFGIESIGEGDASEDALIILVANQALARMQISPQAYTVEINSIGCSKCRPKYLNKLKSYLKTHSSKLCEDCVRRSESNPMRVLDCKNNSCKKVAAGAPSPLDSLCSDCKTHFKSVLEYLEEAGVKFVINSHIVRGLDYYTKTVFEFISQKGSTKGQAIVAGGRYDDLVGTYGKRNAPAVGFGIGIERVIELINDTKVPIEEEKKAQVFIVQLGSSAKKKAFYIMQQLTGAGIKVQSSLSRDSLKSQLKIASKNRVKFALIIGQRELLDKTIIIKDLSTGSQETVDMSQYLTILLERLK